MRQNLARAIERWFVAAARDLPWRTTPRDPYRSLVSEFMLQQTQVSRVLEKFAPFVERFPSIDALARAPESRVLTAWSGLGYYRRARLLHAAAKAIAREHAGRVPEGHADLLALPGVGRYTAGAVASIVFNRPAPIVDGNVARVLLRIHGREQSAAQAQDWLWSAADRLVACARSPALFNEGLMELGALICTPRAPKCGRCPIRESCLALASGDPERIPLPKTPARQKPLYCDAILCRDARDRVLIERRPATSSGVAGALWAKMWQAPTIEHAAPIRSARALADALGLPADAPLHRLESFEHGTTHRRVRFTVWHMPPDLAESLRRARPGSSFRTRAAIANLALSNPQRRILLAGS